MHPCKMYISILYMYIYLYLYSNLMLQKIIRLFSTLKGLAQCPRTDIWHNVLITIVTNPVRKIPYSCGQEIPTCVCSVTL